MLRPRTSSSRCGSMEPRSRPASAPGRAGRMSDRGHNGRAMAERYVDLDAGDRMMIALLQKDGRMTTQALARAVGVSEVTARRKLRRLLNDGVVQIVAAVDPFQIGYESPVIIGLKITDRMR